MPTDSSQIAFQIRLDAQLRYAAEDEAEKQLKSVLDKTTRSTGKMYTSAVKDKTIEILSLKCADLTWELEKVKAINESRWTTEVPTKEGDYMVWLDEDTTGFTIPLYIKLVQVASSLHVTLGRGADLLPRKPTKGIILTLDRFVKENKPTHWKAIPFDVPPELKMKGKKNATR